MAARTLSLSVEASRLITAVDRNFGESRVKNGKSQTTRRFPTDGRAFEVFREWVIELVQLGCGPEDSLFPPDTALNAPWMLALSSREPIEPWKTDAPVRRAFRRVCDHADLSYYNPHSARHYLRAIRDDFCRAAAERKAWSHNLGHEGGQITEDHYAKMTDDQRDDIFRRILARVMHTDEEKNLMLDYHEHLLIPGTPEFERAERLVEARRKRRRAGSCSQPTHRLPDIAPCMPAFCVPAD
ncbi:hypothetical protein [Oricola thermophila]|uniref:Uncharacterized protein n=1 Tax=Oricola thermophila TaxID=2742145 RepID=A0A6N1VC84_9HYPH|nr:hypothetical protein [Oricola thermophila]QKV18153.1 hypothetical protein HTY61_06645 [Oricola thermophila]